MRVVVRGIKERGWFADNPDNPHIAGATGQTGGNTSQGGATPLTKTEDGHQIYEVNGKTPLLSGKTGLTILSAPDGRLFVAPKDAAHPYVATSLEKAGIEKEPVENYIQAWIGTNRNAGLHILTAYSGVRKDEIRELQVKYSTRWPAELDKIAEVKLKGLCRELARGGLDLDTKVFWHFETREGIPEGAPPIGAKLAVWVKASEKAHTFEVVLRVLGLEYAE
jgi:hypothetical protein